jgi:hypothetical protein
MTHEAFAMEHRPTIGERLARRLGFRFSLGEEPGYTEGFEGWARTTVRFQFTFLDRLRILASGRLNVDLTHYADKKFDQMRTRTDFRILAPWEQK